MTRDDSRTNPDDIQILDENIKTLPIDHHGEDPIHKGDNPIGSENDNPIVQVWEDPIGYEDGSFNGHRDGSFDDEDEPTVPITTVPSKSNYIVSQWGEPKLPPHRMVIPRCMREGCNEQELVVRIRETKEEHVFELGYKCLCCLTFYVSTVDTDILQWLFCAALYNTKLKGRVEKLDTSRSMCRCHTLSTSPTPKDTPALILQEMEDRTVQSKYACNDGEATRLIDWATRLKKVLRDNKDEYYTKGYVVGWQDSQEGNSCNSDLNDTTDDDDTTISQSLLDMASKLESIAVLLHPEFSSRLKDIVEELRGLVVTEGGHDE